MKCTARSYWYIAAFVSWLVFCVMIVFLCVEYAYFRQQAEKLIAMQIEYKNHIMSARRLLHVQDREANDSDEKKNGEEPGLFVVNRSPEYIKDISMAFFAKAGLDDLLGKIPTQDWLDYTDYVLTEFESTRQASVQKKPVRRTAKTPANKVAQSENNWVTRQAQKKGNRIFSWPIEPAKFWVSSLFGTRKRANGKWGFHYGLDLAALKKTPVKAAARGIVVEVAHDVKGYGKTIVIAHNTQYKTRYAHLDSILVKHGQKVDRGHLIGRVGSTGAVRASGFDGSHLHFEISSFGKRVNPLYMLK